MLACFTIYDTIRDGILIAEPRHQPYITCPGQMCALWLPLHFGSQNIYFFSAHIYFIQMIYTKLPFSLFHNHHCLGKHFHQWYDRK